jgi:taurine--2-oxoglutarate transaminase
MLETLLKKSEAEEIIKDNQDYTLFSWSKQKGVNPIAVKYAKGVYLYDYDDKRYIDFSSGLMNVNIGHGNQRVTLAVAEQMQQLSYVTPGCVTKARGELGKMLAEKTPGTLNKTLFTVGGAEAIDKMPKGRTGTPLRLPPRDFGLAGRARLSGKRLWRQAERPRGTCRTPRSFDGKVPHG